MVDHLSQIAKETNLESLISLVKEGKPGVLRAIAESSKANPLIFPYLLEHGSSVVRNLVARNRLTPVTVLKELLTSTDVHVRDSARFTLARLSRPKVPQVKLEQTTEEVVLKIKKDKNKKSTRKNKKTKKGERNE